MDDLYGQVSFLIIDTIFLPERELNKNYQGLLWAGGFVNQEINQHPSKNAPHEPSTPAAQPTYTSWPQGSPASVVSHTERFLMKVKRNSKFEKQDGRHTNFGGLHVGNYWRLVNNAQANVIEGNRDQTANKFIFSQ